MANIAVSINKAVVDAVETGGNPSRIPILKDAANYVMQLRDEMPPLPRGLLPPPAHVVRKHQIVTQLEHDLTLALDICERPINNPDYNEVLVMRLLVASRRCAGQLQME